MNEAIKRVELTDEQLEIVVGGTSSNGTSSTITSNSTNTNYFSPTENVVLLGTFKNVNITGPTAQQQNTSIFSNLQSFSTSQPKHSGGSW